MSFLAMPARDHANSPTDDRIVLVHCSAGSARQWTSFAGLYGAFDVVAVDLAGHGVRGPWDGTSPLTLSAEARIISQVVDDDRPVHVVGHSYGGGVALAWAADNPGRLRSLTLIEPSAFHILKTAGRDEARLLDEIMDVAEAIVRGVITGDYRSGMARFIDYWCGPGSWQAMPEGRRTQMASLCVYMAHHFWSLIEDPRTTADYAVVGVPTLLLSGTMSPKPSQAIVRILAAALPDARHRTIEGADHMSPLTHPAEVEASILEHIRNAAGRPERRARPDLQRAPAEAAA